MGAQLRVAGHAGLGVVHAGLQENFFYLVGQQLAAQPIQTGGCGASPPGQGMAGKAAQAPGQFRAGMGFSCPGRVDGQEQPQPGDQTGESFQGWPSPSAIIFSSWALS